MSKLLGRSLPYKVACPNPLKNVRCEVCGCAYVCGEPWRKARTPEARRKARAEQKAREKRYA